MPTKVKKSTKKKAVAAKSAKPAKRTKSAKIAKPAKQTLVWKRSKPGRPKTGSAKKRVTKKKKAVAAELALQEIGKASFATTDINALPEKNGGEHIVGEAKFQLGRKENAGDFQAHNIPFEYGHNRIVLLVVDPKFVFIYWEVQSNRMHEALQAIGHNAKLTLRFHELGSGHSWDVSIYERVGNWYLKLGHPEQHLTVEIGMKNDRGAFYPIARSNTMKLPRTGLAKPGPIKWMLVLPTGEKVITEIEEYTDADLELLKKIMGPYFFDLLRRGRFYTILGSSAENIFTEIEEIQLPNLSS